MFSGEHTHTHTHTFNGLLSRTTRVSRYQKGKTNLDFTEARDSEWQWHISWAICKSASRSRQITMPAPHHSVFLQAGCPSCRPTNSVKALKAKEVFRGRKTEIVFCAIELTVNISTTRCFRVIFLPCSAFVHLFCRNFCRKQSKAWLDLWRHFGGSFSSF